MATLAKCSHCGEPFERLFKFCPNCGLNIFEEKSSVKDGTAIGDLLDIARVFSTISDLDLLLKKISDMAEKLTQSETSSVLLIDDKKESLYFRTAGGEKGNIVKTIRIPLGKGIAGWVAANNQSLLIEDVSKDSLFSSELVDNKTGFKTRSVLCVPVVFQNEVIGVMEVLNKNSGTPNNNKFTVDDLKTLENLAGFAAVSIINSKLSLDQKNFFANIIEILIVAIETRSTNLPGHCWRVAQTSCSIARKLKITGQSYKDIYYASLLHDIGYIGARRQLLAKKGSFSEGLEEKIESLHPAVGAEMLESIHLLKGSSPLIHSHHEFWDGSGFPNQLKGESIPLGARIISFAEAIEELRNPLMTDEEYRDQVEPYISKNSDRLFDPQIVASYLTKELSPKETLV